MCSTPRSIRASSTPDLSGKAATMSQPYDATFTEDPVGPPLPLTVPSPGLSTRDLAAGRQYRSLWGNAWRQFKMHRLAMLGLIILSIITLACFIGTMLYPRSIDDIDFLLTSASPSANYPFGTD